MLTKYQKLVTETIPLTDYMQWNILCLNKHSIETETQLSPNINIHGTAFAGSIYAAAMASGWTLLKFWYDFHHYDTELVAAGANIQYLKPVQSDFICTATLDPESEPMKKLTQRMTSQKSCALPLEVRVFSLGECCAILEVNFVFKC